MEEFNLGSLSLSYLFYEQSLFFLGHDLGALPDRTDGELRFATVTTNCWAPPPPPLPKKLERTHVMSRNGFSLPRSFRGMGGRTSVSGFTSLFSLTQPNKHFLPPLLPLSFRGGVEVRANAVTVPNFYFFLTIVISPASGRHTVLLCSGFWLLLSPPRPSADLRLPKARSRIGTPLLLSFSLGGVARSSGCPSLPSLALLFAVAASNSVPPSLPRAATTHATGRRRGGRTW